jgi:hypothetical protein
LGYWYLVPHSTVFQLYCGSKLYWWRKPEYLKGYIKHTFPYVQWGVKHTNLSDQYWLHKYFSSRSPFCTLEQLILKRKLQRNLSKLNLLWTLKKTESCINQTLKVPVSEIFLRFNLYKIKTCLFRTQKRVTSRFGVDRFSLYLQRLSTLGLYFKFS